eukprot:403376546
MLVQESSLRVIKETIPNNPQQNIFRFEDSQLTLSSNFDSGNISNVTRADKNFVIISITQSILQFTMNICTDAQPFKENGTYRTWFHFRVLGVAQNETLTFNFRQMNHQSKLFLNGMKPVFLIENQMKHYRRIPGDLSFNTYYDGFSITFSHTFTQKNTEDYTYFAFTYPFSYQDIINQAIQLDLEGRAMEMLTISSRKNRTSNLEAMIEDEVLFPHKQPQKRPIRIDKQTVFLSARVHPGEVPSSHVLNGIINFLLQENDQQAKLLRENFVFKIIPCLNPDGVYRGYFRSDTLNQNLNRFYENPDPKLQPTIYAVKKLILQQHELGNLKFYIDLHAHAVKKGCFIFGNNISSNEDQLMNQLFPKLVSMNSLNFDYVECSFNEKQPSAKEKLLDNEMTKDGCGRVCIYQETQLPQCYTLECNYQTGRRLNHIAPRIDVRTNQKLPDPPLQDIHTKIYQEQKTPNYNPEIFEDVGQAICVALLDYIQLNPYSRLPLSQYKNLEVYIILNLFEQFSGFEERNGSFYNWSKSLKHEQYQRIYEKHESDLNLYV